MTRRIVLVSEAFRDADLAAERLTAAGFEVVRRFDLVHRATPQQLIDSLSTAWAVVAGSERYTREVFRHLPELRVIARPGVGVDGIDLDAASRYRVAVLTTPGANDEAVADLTLTLMLAGLRRLLELDGSVRHGEWRPPWIGADLAGATVGVVGLGRIGQAVVRRLVGFGCRVLAVETHPDERFVAAHGVTLMTLPELLPRVDVITLHVPLMPATRGLLGAVELAMLPSHALVVNTARGGLIDEPALIDALHAGRLGGAGLDVFEREPLSAQDPLVRCPRTLLTPHHAAFTRGGINGMVDATVDNLLNFASAGRPVGCVNADRLGLGGGMPQVR